MAKKIINSKDRRSAGQDAGINPITKPRLINDHKEYVNNLISDDKVEQDIKRAHKFNFINNIQLTNNKNTVYKRGWAVKPAVKEYNIYNASKKIADNNKINNSAKISKRAFDYQYVSISSNKFLVFILAITIMFFYLVFSMPFAVAAPADPGHGAASILGGQNKNE